MFDPSCSKRRPVEATVQRDRGGLYRRDTRTHAALEAKRREHVGLRHATRMSFTAIYSVAVVFSALFFVGWYLLSRSKKSPPATLEEPPRWHKWFDDPV